MIMREMRPAGPPSLTTVPLVEPPEITTGPLRMTEPRRTLPPRGKVKGILLFLMNGFDSRLRSFRFATCNAPAPESIYAQNRPYRAGLDSAHSDHADNTNETAPELSDDVFYERDVIACVDNSQSNRSRQQKVLNLHSIPLENEPRRSSCDLQQFDICASIEICRGIIAL
jgi:hypothetical protein